MVLVAFLNVKKVLRLKKKKVKEEVISEILTKNPNKEDKEETNENV